MRGVDPGAKLLAQVVVDHKARAVNRLFDYAVPQRLVATLQPGHRVYVSFGRQHCQAYVVDIRDQPQSGQWKPILAVLDEFPLLTAELLGVADRLMNRYLCTRQAAIATMLPRAYRATSVTLYRAVASFERQSGEPLCAEADVLRAALTKRALSLATIVRRFGTPALRWLETLQAQGGVEQVLHVEDAVGAKRTSWLCMAPGSTPATLRAAQDAADRAPTQRRLLLALAQDSVRLRDVGLRPSHPSVQALVRSGCAQIVRRDEARTPVVAISEPVEADRHLTSGQQRALRVIQSLVVDQGDHALVLHGITGSGKTEVYLQAISTLLAAGYGSITLVPEIALTPQMVGRFIARFGAQVAVLHSGLSDGERRDEWLRIRQGEATVVVGARSAVFAPVKRLKLVIVDEAHEASYKQEDGPHYDAREVARWRAEEVGGVVVYGSATPSLELLRDVELGRAQLATLPTRVNQRPLPTVDVVDMREELKSGNRSIFSESLRSGLTRAVQSGKQAILFLNRRGYAAFVLCRSCGSSLRCPHCDISLTLHRSSDSWMECHYCGYREPQPAVCPVCAEPALRPYGVGTQQVQQALATEWPDLRVLRMDVDTTRRRGAHREVLQQFASGQADVLLGTQMIAKGLDFPDVTFVGVIAADTMLNLPDFRAAERTFQLLTQVVGRAGRAQAPGTTVIQTYRPDHPAVIAAAHHDFSGFYQQERRFRELFAYPPFCELTVFVTTHAQETVARGGAARFERELQRRLQQPDVVVLPASPTSIGRVSDQYRYQVVVKYAQWESVRQQISEAYELVHARLRALGGRCRLDVQAMRM